ncbi:MAG: hypothetical protein NC822_06160, partial [Candidatus Omnitrophica bacterium]|nr:hypothetical protein [Candidatus Omnitrophota bacterium]
MARTKMLLFLMFFSFLFSGCQNKDKLKLKDYQELIPVRVKMVRLSTIRKVIEYVGDIKAKDEAIVYPKVSGKVLEKLKEDGSFVSKGEIIAYIDRDEVGFKFEKSPIESPLTGVVGRFYLDKGEMVTPQTPVALVVDMEK